MPVEGQIIGRYNRKYRYIKPLDSDPGTYRLATPDQGGGDGTPHNIVGVNPIQATTTANGAKTTISLNIQSLPPRSGTALLEEASPSSTGSAYGSAHEIVGVDPIEANTTGSPVLTTTNISLNIQSLDYRE